MGVTTLRIFTMEVTPHFLCCVLWVKSKSQLTLHLRERHQHPEVGGLGATFYKEGGQHIPGLGFQTKLPGPHVSMVLPGHTVSPYTQKIKKIFFLPIPKWGAISHWVWGDPLPNFPHFSLLPHGPWRRRKPLTPMAGAECES